MNAVAQLDEHYGELKSAARQRLGNLYNSADYPPSLRGLFDLAWEFPNVQPPEYLLQLNPAIYEQEKSRIAARFEEAVRLAEQAFVNEFAGLVSHLCERLNEGDGEKKIFRDTAVTNLIAFFERFRQLNVHSNDQLDELVVQAQNLVRGVEPQTLRVIEARTFCTAGTSRAIRIAMMARTTSSSMSVKARRDFSIVVICHSPENQAFFKRFRHERGLNA